MLFMGKHNRFALLVLEDLSWITEKQFRKQNSFHDRQTTS